MKSPVNVTEFDKNEKVVTITGLFHLPEENGFYVYARSRDCSVSVGRIGKLECDFIIRNRDMNYAYVQVAYTIALSEETENREYRPLEMIKDNYPKSVMTTDYLPQKRNGIIYSNIIDFMRDEKNL